MTPPASPPAAPSPYIDPDLVVIESTVNGPDDAEVTVDVVDVLVPSLLQALARDRDVRLALNRTLAALDLLTTWPGREHLIEALHEEAEQLAGLLRAAGVGVLVMPDVMAADIGYRIADGPARCHAVLDRTTRERCQNYADACKHHGGAE